MAEKPTIKKNRSDRVLVWALLVFLSAGVFYIVLLATKIRLSGDDYCLDAILKQEGLWGMVIRSYLEVSMYNGNRYAQIFFSGLAGLSPTWGNGLLVGLSLLAWITGLTFLVRWLADLMRLSLKYIEVLVIVLGFVNLVLWGTPRLDQSVIWRSAMTAYFMPMMSLTWLLVFVIKTGMSKTMMWWRLLVVFLTAVLGAGFSETGAAYQGAILGLLLILILAALRRYPTVKAYLVPVVIALLGVLVGVALMYFSPVTQMRRDSMPAAMPLSEVISLLALNVKVYLWHKLMRRTWTVLVPFIFGLGLGLLAVARQHENPDHKLSKISWLHWSVSLVLVPISSVFIIMSVMLPATFVQVSYPPERSLILAESVMMMACIMGGALIVFLINSLPGFVQIHAIRAQPVFRWVGVFCVLVVLISPILLIQQNANKYSFFTRWSQMWDSRHQELLQAGLMNADEVHVVELDHVISDVGELSPDPDYWYNNCAEMYYGVKSIYADLPGW